jgi:polysaccharide biosynthesis protein PslA
MRRQTRETSRSKGQRRTMGTSQTIGTGQPASIRAQPAGRLPGSRLNARLVIALLAIDTLCMIGSFYLAGQIYDQVTAGGVSWQAIALTIFPVYFLVAAQSHAYAPALLNHPYRSATSSVRAFLIALAVIIFVAFAFKTSSQFSRLTFAFGSVLGLVSLPVARYAFARRVKRLRGGLTGTVLLCDAGTTPPSPQYHLVSARDIDIDPTKDDPLMYDRLASELSEAERVVVVCSPERRNAWAHALKGAYIQSEIVIPELAQLAPLGVSRHGLLPTLIVSAGPLKLSDRVIKRAFDLALAGPAVLLLSPLLIAVAILIKLDSPGPVLFKQVRIGRGNQMFQMLKFRSMRVETLDGAGARSNSRDDDRITRLGAFIRKTSIDELPQLINVLRGDMSIVGPRPHALGSRAADKLFWEVDGRYWHRHSAKPGLTGLAQVRGYRGATFHEDDLTNRLQADLEYLDHWTIWRDIQIVGMTFRVLLHRNAF